MGYGESLYQSYQSKIKVESPEPSVQAYGSIAWLVATPVTPGKVVVINGVTFTFVAADPEAPFEVLIGADSADTTDNLKNAIQAYEPLYTIVEASQDYDADTLYITALQFGEAGNDFTLTSDEASFTVTDFANGAQGTRSAEAGDIYLSSGLGYVYICTASPSDSSAGEFYRIIVEADPR